MVAPLHYCLDTVADPLRQFIWVEFGQEIIGTHFFHHGFIKYTTERGVKNDMQWA